MSENKTTAEEGEDLGLANILERPAPSTLAIDLDYFRPFLDDTDIPEERKQELLEVLWNIVVNFVDLGFGIHPIQHAMLEQEKSKQKKKDQNTGKETP